MKNAIYGILAIALVVCGELIEGGEVGRRLAGGWLVVCGLTCALQWLRGSRS
jgi:hypothetical protein